MNIIEKMRYRYYLGSAVKEALDSLPTAICYFRKDGSVKCCNNAMYETYRKIAHSDLQYYEELSAAMADCDKATGVIKEGNIFIFPDGHVKQYSERKIKTSNGRTFTEAVFSDVTELYEKRLDLQRQSRDMKKMYGELQKLSGQLQEITREQEILNMKVLLHDQMNMGITAIRKVLRQDMDSGENAEAIAQFRRAIQILQEENAYAQDDLSEFIRDAKVSGVQVNISGDLPEGRNQSELMITVLREACVNAARHADAYVLNILSELTEDRVTLRITNDGKAPEGEIEPRGGLKDLGEKIKKAGGSFEIRSLPEFVLTVTLPITESVVKEEKKYDESTCDR